MTYEMTVKEINNARLNECPRYTVTVNGKTENGRNWEYAAKAEIIALLDTTKTYEVHYYNYRNYEYGMVVVEEKI